MKKKLFTSLACVALAFIGALGLVGCGTKAEVSFGRVKGYYMDHDIDVAATTWTKVTKTEDGAEEGYLTFKIDEQNLAYNASTKDTEVGAYCLAITFAGKGDVTKAEIMAGSEKGSLSKLDYKQRTDKEGNNIKENDEIVFIKIEKQAAAYKNEAKTFYLTIDWKEDDKNDEKNVYQYKFIIEKDALTLGEAPTV